MKSLRTTSKEPDTVALRAMTTKNAAGPLLRISDPNDAYEREADRMANEIMSGGPISRHWSLSNVRVGAPLQRKCDCGSSSATGECEACKRKEEEKMVQRKPACAGPPEFAPPIVHDVLNSAGQPLDRNTRNFFEPKFGRELSKVRVHTGTDAAISARRVNALAYSVREDIVFGECQYAPETTQGRGLLAHELAHTLQARNNTSVDHLHRQPIQVPGSPPGVGLAGPYTGYQPFPPSPAPPPITPCLVSPECSKPIAGSSWDFDKKVDVEQAKNAAEIKASPEKAKAAGVERPARFLTKFSNDIDPTLLTGIEEVRVNPAIGGSAGAQHVECKNPDGTPSGKDCIEVPDSLEKQAEEFKTTNHPMIGGMSRPRWQADALKTLTHEVAHAKFGKAPPVGKGTTVNPQKVANYSPDIFLYELDEMNALFSEYPIEYNAVMNSSKLKAEDKPDAIRQWINDYAIRNGDEDLQGMLKKLRCISPCSEVDNAVKKVFASQSAKWTTGQKTLFLGEVSEPKNGLNWPK